MLASSETEPCLPGFLLQQDRLTCKTIDIWQSLVRPLISNLKDTIVIDYLRQADKTLMFWSDC